MDNTENMPTMPLEGGARRKRTAAKKPASAKPKTSNKKKGGAMMDDIKNLAVPFAILLAKQGLEGMFDKSGSKVGVAASPKKTPAKSPAKKSPATKKAQSGGACATCQNVTGTMSGGSSRSRSKKTSDVKRSYQSLAERIDKFLSKH